MLKIDVSILPFLCFGQVMIFDKLLIVPKAKAYTK